MCKGFFCCFEVNDWSLIMYYYMVGIVFFELYCDVVEKGDEVEVCV